MELRQLDRLHAKVFLTDTRGYLGSANLTSAGLGSAARANAELSIVLDDRQRADAERVFARWWSEAHPVDEADIDECRRRAAAIPTRLSPPPRQKPRQRRLNERGDDLLAHAEHVNVWVKAVYRGAESYPWRSPWISSTSKGKPKFRDGDLIVVYAKYARKCFTVLRVVGDTVHDIERQIADDVLPDRAERWPWVTDVELELEVTPARGVPLPRMGLTGQSLQNGHCHMPVGGFAAALGDMLG